MELLCEEDSAANTAHPASSMRGGVRCKEVVDEGLVSSAHCHLPDTQQKDYAASGDTANLPPVK